MMVTTRRLLRLCSLLLAMLALVPAASAESMPPIGRAVYVRDHLLLNYDPQSALNAAVTQVEQPRFEVVDIHCHWSLELEPDALLTAMDERGIRRAINLSGGHGEQLDQMLERFHDAAPGRLIIFGSLDYDGIGDPDWAQRMVAFLEQASARGMAGLKVWKDLGLTVRDTDGENVAIDDPRLDPVWDACGRLGLPVLIHSADPVAFFQPIDRHNERWMQLRRHPSWSFHGEQFPSRDTVLAQRDRVLQRHRGTTFIGAHMAGNSEDLAALAERLEQHPNLYVDISGRVGELGRQPYSARRLLVEHADRVLFGSDRYPGRTDQPRYRIYYRFLETNDEYFDYHDHSFPPAGDWKIYGVFLPEAALRRIYHENAERLLGLAE
ncbi:MAG: amidohydrolase family protein [Phycisphaeraceae bacterium]